jgi:hypothetical protein
MARAARVAPTVPPAPATFSITNDWPRWRDKMSAAMRPITSAGPPAANGTITVTVRVG